VDVEQAVAQPPPPLQPPPPTANATATPDATAHLLQLHQIDPYRIEYPLE
jgi:hypothetical protein